MRCILLAGLLVPWVGIGLGQASRPTWFDDGRSFCEQIGRRTNGLNGPVPFGPPKRREFSDYPARPVAAPRSEPAVLGKDDWDNPRVFAASIAAEAAKGPDFAGRYMIVEWSCGTACSNALVADTRTRATYKTPFVGVAGCGLDSSTRIQRRADSALLIVQGKLEIAEGHYFHDGPCGIFYYAWQPSRMRLVGCDIPPTVMK